MEKCLSHLGLIDVANMFKQPISYISNEILKRNKIISEYRNGFKRKSANYNMLKWVGIRMLIFIPVNSFCVMCYKLIYYVSVILNKMCLLLILWNLRIPQILYIKCFMLGNVAEIAFSR